MMHASSQNLVKLLSSLPIEEVSGIYESHGINPWEGPEVLVQEIEKDGGNSLANLFRGNVGVSYFEILLDCAEKLDIKLDREDRNHSVESLEELIVIQSIEKYLEKASLEDRTQIEQALKELGAEKQSVSNAIMQGVGSAALMILIQQAGKQVVTQVIKTIMLRIAAIEAGKRTAQTIMYAVPLVNVLFAAWTIYDLSGPAFRKTIPTVLNIALLRLQHQSA
jgi:uncharacterized protein YaaW (UPF0174 family)